MCTQMLHLPPTFDMDRASGGADAGDLLAAQSQLLPGYLASHRAALHLRRSSLGPHLQDRLHALLGSSHLHGLLST